MPWSRDDSPTPVPSTMTWPGLASGSSPGARETTWSQGTKGTVFHTFLCGRPKRERTVPRLRNQGAGTCSVLGSNSSVMSTPTRKWVPRVPRETVHSNRGPQFTKVYHATRVEGTHNGCHFRPGAVTISADRRPTSGEALDTTPGQASQPPAVSHQHRRGDLVCFSK